MTTTHRTLRRLLPLALLLRMLAIAVLLAGAGRDAVAASVSVVSIAPVANEASHTTAVVQFNRDTASGPLVVQFTLSGPAAAANLATQPTFALSSSAAFTILKYTPMGSVTVSGTITIADGDAFEQLVITPLDNSAITGDLPLVVTVEPAGTVYDVVLGASAVQIDIAEGDYQASVVVPAPVAYENTALVGGADDPNAPRRGILRVAFSPIATFPGTPTAPGVSQFYLSHTTGTPPAIGSPLTIGPTVPGGTFSATSTTLLTGLAGNGFLGFSPRLNVSVPVGSTVTSGGFTGTIDLVPPPPGHTLPLYDKALKVQFGGTAALPMTATGAAAGATPSTDQYYVTYKIGGSPLGSVTNPVSNGSGWNVVAYPGSAGVPGTTSVNLGMGGTIPAGGSVIINGHTYALTAAYGGAPGPLSIAGGLVATVHDGDTVQAVGIPTFAGQVSAPVLPGTTAFTIENGLGSLARGDVFTLAGEDASVSRYVILTVAANPIVATDLDITFRRYTAGTVGFDGVNNLHSALIGASAFPSPALNTQLNVSDDAPFSKSLNLFATGGLVQLLIPAEAALVDFGINPIDNAVVLGRQTVTMSLQNDLNYAATTPTAGQVIIAEADSTASISTTANAVQGAPPTVGSFLIALTNPFSYALTVPFTITGSGSGVGQPNIDYTLASTSNLAVDNGIYSIVIPANGTTATISVATIPGANLGLNGKTVTITLSPTYDYLLASTSGSLNASATLSLLPPPPPVPQLSVAWGSDAQQPPVYNNGSIPGFFTINAQVAPVSNLTVQYALSGGAAPGADYLTPAGYSVFSGTGVATILAGNTSVAVVVDPNINPLPPFNANDQARITLLPAGTYTLTSIPTSTATLVINQGQIRVNQVKAEGPDGTFHAGDGPIYIDVTFSAPVTVGSGTLVLALNTGSTHTVATYAPIIPAPPLPSAILRFSYTVAAGDVNPRLDYASVAALSGNAIISDANGAHTTPYPVSTALPPPATTGSLFANSHLVIDGTPAVAFDVGSHVNPSEINLVDGQFVVTANPAPTADLTVFYTLSGTAVVNTDIAPLNGTPGQLTIHAAMASTLVPIIPLGNPLVNTNETVILTLIGGAGYHLGTPVGDQLTIVQDHIGVTGVTTTTANGTYHIGATISLAVTFTAAVAVSGTPQLALNTGASNAFASYVSGSGTTTLLFTYVVGVGDVSALLDYAATSALTGTITDATASLPVTLTLPAPGSAGSLSASSALVIDGLPTIAIDPSSHSEPSEVALAPGKFRVTCTPAPASALTVTYTLGGSAVIGTDIAAPAGTFTAATATGQLTIPAGQLFADLAITPLANPVLNTSEQVTMTLAASASYHLAGAPAVITDTLTVGQDSIGVVSVTAVPSTGTRTLGQQIAIMVTFSAPVAVTGTPTLALNTGSTNALATLSGGNGTDTLTFTYVVGAGDLSPHLDYLSTSALNHGLSDDSALHGGVFSDGAGGMLSVSTVLATPGGHGSLAANSSLVINGSIPAVTAVSATSPDGTYTFAQSLTLTVAFSLPVNVSGTPELQLATGTVPAEATYAGGNGTTTLTFTYVVGANDASADLDCTSPSALTLNGGAITWAGAGAGAVAAALALPVPGATGSLGANKALVINGALPTGKPPVGSISGPNAGTGGGCGLGSGIAGLAAGLALLLRAATLRRHRRGTH